MIRNNGNYGKDNFEDYQDEQHYTGNKRVSEPQNDTRPKVFHPNLVAEESMDASIKLGYQVGKQVLNNTKFVDYFSLQFLKPYFDVNNSYVTRKIKMVLFPFLHKRTESEQIEDASCSEVQKAKIEYADLYLPLMSFITYVLLIAFNSGRSANFNPEIFGKTATKDFAILVLYTIVLKSGKSKNND